MIQVGPHVRPHSSVITGYDQRLRNFTELTIANSDHYTIPAITLSDDFSIEFDFQLNVLTGDLCLLGDNSTDTNWYRIDATNGGIDYKIRGSFVSNDGQFTADTDLHHVKITRVGNVIAVYLDDVVVTTNTGAGNLGDVVFGSIGYRTASLPNHFGGIIANVTITDDGTLVRSYSINDADPATIIDSESAEDGTGVNVTSADTGLYITANGALVPL